MAYESEEKDKVLIVAKCNVNHLYKSRGLSSHAVLIVAKCNVNQKWILKKNLRIWVLIVAKCNVNYEREGIREGYYEY